MAFTGGRWIAKFGGTRGKYFRHLDLNRHTAPVACYELKTVVVGKKPVVLKATNSDNATITFGTNAGAWIGNGFADQDEKITGTASNAWVDYLYPDAPEAPAPPNATLVDETKSSVVMATLKYSLGDKGGPAHIQGRIVVLSSGSLGERVVFDSQRQTTGGEMRTLHSAELKDLQPDATYTVIAEVDTYRAGQLPIAVDFQVNETITVVSKYAIEVVKKVRVPCRPSEE